jgi:hypothetical protein
MRTFYPSTFSKPEVIIESNRLREEFVLVPADKACNIIFACKAHYHHCIINNELGINSAIVLTPQLLFPKMKFIQTTVLNTLNTPCQIHDDNELPYI